MLVNCINLTILVGIPVASHDLPENVSVYAAEGLLVVNETKVGQQFH